MGKEQFQAAVAAVQWNGAESDARQARELLQPRYNVFRMQDRLRGQVLKISEGANCLTVPRGSWIVRADGGGAKIFSDSDFRLIFQPSTERKAEAPAPWL